MSKHKLIIAIGGPSGVGKSEIAARIATKYGLPHLSMGYFFREMAKKKELDIYELSEKVLEDSDIDKKLTEMVIKEINKIKRCIIDGHGVGLFLNDKYTFKILLYAPIETRVERISRRDNMPVSNLLQKIQELDSNTSIRFKEYYGKNIYDIENYDLAINVAKFNLNEVEEFIYNVFETKGFLQ